MPAGAGSQDGARATSGKARVGAAVRNLAMQSNSRDVSRLLGRLLPDLVEADRAHCLYYDGASNSLWYEGDSPSEDYEATGGIAGFAAFHGAAANLPRAESNPHYAPATDDPAGRGDERLLIQPVLSQAGTAHAVLVAVRGPRKPSFSAAQAEVLSLFARQCGPLLDALSWELEEAAAAALPTGVFRAEAIEAYASRGEQGDVIRVYSPWVRAAYWLLAAFAVVAGAYSVFGTVHEFASGPAVVMSAERVDVASAISGQLEKILVRPGQAVDEGEVLARLSNQDVLDEVRLIEQKFERRLAARLLDLDDVSAEQSLAATTDQLENAKRALASFDLRAPEAGRVGEVLIEKGEMVEPGDYVVSIVPGQEQLELVAAVPAAYRPLIAPNTPARISWVGHPGEHVELHVREISRDAFGPAAAARKIGRRLGDTIPVSGTVVFVSFDLPAGGLQLGGKEFPLHLGMQAQVDVRVRSERIAAFLFPALKDFIGSEYDD